MLGELVLLIGLVIMEVVKYFFKAIDWAIPTDADTALTTAISDFGTKADAVYHLIPAADTLITIIGILMTFMSLYFIFRFFVFVYNIINHSGSQA